MNNPLFDLSPVPVFDQIKPEHFQEAYKKVFQEIEVRYLELKQEKSPSTFENSVLPFDTLFSEYSRISQVLSLFYKNKRTEEIPPLMKEANLAANVLSKKIYQDRDLASRFKSVYENRSSLHLDKEDSWFLQNLYFRFEASGAFLKEEDQQALLDIDAELIKQAQACFDIIMGPGRKQQAFLVTRAQELLGVGAEQIEVFKQQAKKAGYEEGYFFIPERLLVDELLEVASDRGFRQKIHEAMNRVGTVSPYDNEATIKEIVTLRDRRSKMLGYESFAHYQQARSMAGSVQRVHEILNESLKNLLPRYEEDMMKLESWVKEKGGPTTLEPWDVAYYSAQYKREVLGFDAQELAKHLEFENVLSGWIKHASISMNLEFTRTYEYPVWDLDVRVFQVYDKDSHQMNVLYIDPYARPENKDGGAWMTQIQSPDPSTGRLNAIIFNMNLTKPSEGQKAFLDKDQTATFYHEGGHALNGLKGQQAKYRSQRGTGNGSTFVEIHSIMQERVPYTTEVIATYAFDPKTQKLPEKSLLEKMEKADHFLATREALKIIQNALRDLLLHSISSQSWVSTQDIEEKAALHTRYSSHVRSYPLRRFDHLFGSGLSQYAAGYCGYYLASVAQAAASEPFIERGLYDPDLLNKQREFYSIGAGLEPNFAYERFTGKKLGDLRPYLKSLGITSN